MSTCISTWLFLPCEYTLGQWPVSCLSCSTLRTSFEQLKSRKQATWSATVPVLLLLYSFSVKWLILLYCCFWLQKSRTSGTFTSNCLIYWKRRWKRLRHSENGRESRGGRYWKKLLDIQPTCTQMKRGAFTVMLCNTAQDWEDATSTFCWSLNVLLTQNLLTFIPLHCSVSKHHGEAAEKKGVYAQKDHGGKRRVHSNDLNSYVMKKSFFFP